MTQNPAIAELKSRSVLRVSGADSFSFLQNLVSQDLARVTPENPVFSALLTPQGKYAYDFFVAKDGDGFLLDAEAGRIDDVQALLTRYRIRGDVTFENLAATHGVFAFWNGDAPGIPLDPRLGLLGQRGIFLKTEAPAAPIDESAYREHRYCFGVAEGSHEIDVGQATLLEINFDALHAISFEKGCYMGQELTARTHYRGLIKRRYLPFRFEGAAPSKASHIIYNGIELGDVHAVGVAHGIGLFHIENTKPYRDVPFIHEGTRFDIFVPDYLKE